MVNVVAATDAPDPDNGPASLYASLEPLLMQVGKPVQYVGGEVNAVSKPWASADVHWVLMYPDAYELGQPNQGLAILYEVLNEQDWILAERSFAIWPDLTSLMHQHRVPQFTWDSHRPVAAFDVLGISLATELGYTNVLQALHLSGIALHAAERTDDDPLVIAGGHAAFNPEPMADFLDGVVLGDGEEAVLRISGIIRDWKAAGRPGGRDEVLTRLADIVYVPKFYDVAYRDDGTIANVTPNRPGVPVRVRKHVLTQLDDWQYPAHPLVPLAETVHERYSVEIFRGCSRGCRFCQAGFVTRPVRERNIQTIGKMAEQGLAATGLEEVGLLSLSSADHSEIAVIARQLADRYENSHVSLSLPSTRVDAFNVGLASELTRGGRRSGLTFAPEGGTERLRRVVNKQVTEEDLLKTVAAAYSQGWRQIKLYFMCGLPTETDEDVQAIADLATRVIETGRRVSGSRDISCTISIGGFVPKPHTPFQWVGQTPAAVVDERLRRLKATVRADRRYGRAISIRYQDGKPGIIEGLLSRGDRRVGPIIEAVWADGGLFDGWSEYFSYERWERCVGEVLADTPISLDWYTTRERAVDEVLPWDHLDVGLDRDWLWEDYRDALAGVEVDDCRWNPCHDCGVCSNLDVDIDIGPTGLSLLEVASKGRLT